MEEKTVATRPSGGETREYIWFDELAWHICTWSGELHKK
jgi:hypothetical protein